MIVLGLHAIWLLSPGLNVPLPLLNVQEQICCSSQGNRAHKHGSRSVIILRLTCKAASDKTALLACDVRKIMHCMCALQLFDLGPDGKSMRKVDEINNLAEKAQQAVGGKHRSMKTHQSASTSVILLGFAPACFGPMKLLRK